MENKNCKNCKFFYITWDKNFPYGCKKLKFKSKKIPSDEVVSLSGFQCLGFEQKNKSK